ncbi:unnamed protein product [Pleuronectes platessa]|uniref:Uncharacterized protein n=1 Tax=Pleuronectes platessa TaxID=8262 RepID=A0A9N7V0R8_PLEPL|nr:unnamed protein product [Pleuronectes platessa]
MATQIKAKLTANHVFQTLVAVRRCRVTRQRSEVASIYDANDASVPSVALWNGEEPEEGTQCVFNVVDADVGKLRQCKSPQGAIEGCAMQVFLYASLCIHSLNTNYAALAPPPPKDRDRNRGCGSEKEQRCWDKRVAWRDREGHTERDEWGEMNAGTGEGPGADTADHIK